jgi:hypothetical protein
MAFHGINAFADCCLAHVDQDNVEALCRGSLGDAAAHRSGADHADCVYWHARSLLWLDGK